jgi:dTDP-4-amino-4,6-dideoxygalactose transaminase
MIPLFGVAAEYKKLRKELHKAALRVLDSGLYILGPETSAFESEFAVAQGLKYAIGLSSGTNALEIALKALNIGPGDEVVVPTFTFVATAAAVSAVGASPVFCDIGKTDLNSGAKEIEAVLTPKTKAVIPVHLYGHPANMASIMSLAQKRGIYVIEDCAQAHLAQYRGRPVGSFGAIAAFSFYPSKNLGAMGDAGAVLTNSQVFAETCLELRNSGRGLKGPTYEYSRIAGNSRMAEIQAALLRVKLKGLQKATERRRVIAKIYAEELGDLPLVLPDNGNAETKPAFHLYVLRLDKRDQLADHLKKSGVSCGVYYPLSLHRQTAYRYLNLNPESFPNAESACKTVLAIPMNPALSMKDVARVVKAVRSFFN